MIIRMGEVHGVRCVGGVPSLQASSRPSPGPPLSPYLHLFTDPGALGTLHFGDFYALYHEA